MIDMKRWMALFTVLMLLAACIPGLAEAPEETVPEGKQLMTLTLPDTETMRDPGWQLLADGEWVDILPLSQTDEIWRYPDQILKILSGLSPLVNPANYRTERLELPQAGLEAITF
jgi:hypothetical protein